MPAFKLPKTQDDANPTLSGSISAGDTTVLLNTGEGALLPTIYRGTATSGGDQVTLNDTGIGASGVAVGDFIENETDGSCAIIRTVSADSVVTTPLRNGSGNTWDNSDVWSVNRFYCRLRKLDASGNVVKKEKVLVSNRSTDTLTVVRAQDGDSGQSFDADDYCELLVMKVHVDEMQKAIRDLILTIDEIDRGAHGYAAATNSSNDYTVNLSPKYTSLTDLTGKVIVWKASAANTGTATLNLNGTGATAIKKEGGASDVVSGDIANNMAVITIYNGTSHIMVNPPANAPAGSDLTIETKTADYTILSSESNKVFRTTTNIFTLTMPSVSAGKHYGFLNNSGLREYIKHSSTIYVDGLTGTYLVHNGSADGSTEIVDVDGSVRLLMYMRGTFYIWNGKGYINNGGTQAAFWNGNSSKIDNIDFAAETSTELGTAAVNAYGSRASGCSALKGYSIAGYNSSNGGAIGAIEALTFAAETTAALSATCDTVRGLPCGISAPLGAYALGGETNAGLTTVNTISKLLFSGETEANVAATLDTAGCAGAGFSTSTKGYHCGGMNNSQTKRTTVENVVFADDTSAAIGGTLATAFAACGSCESSTVGYMAGTYNSASAAMQKFTLASETGANLAETLGTARGFAAGVAATKGYFAGGGDFGSNVYNIIDDIVFAAETSATMGMTLDVARRGPNGLISTSK